MPPKKQYPLWAYLCGCSVTSATECSWGGGIIISCFEILAIVLTAFFRFIGLKLWISVWVFICGMSGISVWYIDSIGDLIPGMWKFYGSWWFCIQFSILIKNICSFEVLDVFFTVLWFLIDPNAPWLIAIHSLKGALITVSAFANKASRNVTKTNLFTLSFKSVKRYFLSR